MDTNALSENDELVEAVKGVLERAEQAVRKAKLQPDHQAVGFECAVRILSTSAYPIMAVPTQPPFSQREKVLLSDSSDHLAVKCNEHDVDYESLMELFTLGDDGKIMLTIASQLLPKGKKAGLEAIALTLSFVREGIGDEGATRQDEIAAAAEHYGVKDTNFAKHMKSMEVWFQPQPVGGSKKAYRLKRAGWEEAAKVLKRMTEV